MAFFSRDEGHRWWNFIGKIQSNFSKSMKKVIGFVDVQRGIRLNKSGYVHRRDFDELLEYEISLESFHLCWKSEQLFEKNFDPKFSQKSKSKWTWLRRKKA